mmetsp:Transcript_68014/g.113968  ORF Transcript_68014/g.113968 Transcript_68014/m.113968 type:complete len:135 (+) Transcript_68014:167-571(+)
MIEADKQQEYAKYASQRRVDGASLGLGSCLVDIKMAMNGGRYSTAQRRLKMQFACFLLSSSSEGKMSEKYAQVPDACTKLNRHMAITGSLAGGYLQDLQSGNNKGFAFTTNTLCTHTGQPSSVRRALGPWDTQV